MSDEDQRDNPRACTYPGRNHGDGRGCQVDDCPRHGGEGR